MDTWAISKLVVCAEANTPQLKKFLETHPGDVPGFSLEVPVPCFDDEELQQSWGTSSLPEALHPRVLRSTSVTYVFKTKYTPPLAWVACVAKRYRDLAFELTYAIPAFMHTGWVWRSGDIMKTMESDGIPQEVDEFLLSVE